MPVYEYLCEAHGDFQAVRPMRQYLEPHPCPTCGREAARTLRTAPRVGSTSRAALAAHAVNERAADSPKRAHGAGCRCCGGSNKLASGAADGAKNFPGKRPWMISH
jgi:putative FmdB family regulatory protein